MRWCVIVGMLNEAVAALREWQSDDAPMQLHPGDIGWFWRAGADATAAAVRTWRRDGRIVAVGLLDTPTLLRLTIAPDAVRDPELADQLADDLDVSSVELPDGVLLKELLAARGWRTDEAWTPLRFDLAEPVRDPGVRIEVAGPEEVTVRTAIQRAAFDGSTFTDEAWRTMANGPLYADARCLVAYDRGEAVAAATVWSAGPGRPGLLEPMGVHRAHRGHGYGRAISVAAAAALREMGSSSAWVCTPSSNVGAVATYRSAGFVPGPQRLDLARDA